MTNHSPQRNVAAHLIGVIDIRGGFAVHAVAGRRADYQLAIADDVPDGDALKLAKRYAELGVKSLYIADLDAICDHRPNVPLLAKLASCAEVCFIDAGDSAVELVQSLPAEKQTRFVLPTESFDSVDHWTLACEVIGSQQVVLGLDLEGPRLRVRGAAIQQTRSAPHLNDTRWISEFWRNVSPWVSRADELNVAGLLVLDLAYVGTSGGPGCATRCQIIRSHQEKLPIISGGGIRCFEDVTSLLQAGCDHVLVGTALHRDSSAAKVLYPGLSEE